MKKVLAIYLDRDRTYVTITQNHPDGLILEYLNSTSLPIDLDALHTEPQDAAFNEIDKIIQQSGLDFDNISIVFPGDSLLISHMPSKAGITREEIMDLIAIEIKRTFPSLNLNNFQIQVFQLQPLKNKIQKQIAVVYQINDIQLFEQYFAKYGKEINPPYVSQIAAANAFMYNYPEHHSKNVAVAGVQNNYIDFCVLTAGKITHLGLQSYSTAEQIPLALEDLLQKATTEIVETLDGGVYLYGKDINQTNFISCWEIGMMFGIEVKRLGAFRMTKTKLGKREQEYAFKTVHYYAPCIGASIPLYFESIIL